MSIFPDMELKKKLGIKNSNCLSAWTCLVFVGSLSVISKYCNTKLVLHGRETERFRISELNDFTYFI